MPTQDHRFITNPYPEPEKRGFWRRELPYLVILALTVGGAGYVGIMRQPIVLYWSLVALAITGICVVTGWRALPDGSARWRLIWTQLLHWAAFLIAMNMVFLPSMQSVLNAESTNLVVLFLLGLGTFVAGVHTASFRLCANGAAMALLVPGLAWLDQSALVISLILLVALAIGLAVLWHKYGPEAD